MPPRIFKDRDLDCGEITRRNLLQSNTTCSTEVQELNSCNLSPFKMGVLNLLSEILLQED
jgi:hypothetical protein